MIMVWSSCFCCFASVSSSTGNLSFDVNADGQSEANLSATGFKIGSGTASANLEVSGNAMLQVLDVGGQGGSSNLNIHGSMGHSFVTYSAGNHQISGHSMVLADSSAGNVKLTLPTPIDRDGQIFVIKKTSTSHELVIKSSHGTLDARDLIHVSAGNLSHHRLISSANNWYVLSSSGHESNLSLYSDNLLLHYRFDDASGNVAQDAKGLHHGQLIGSFTFSGCTTTGVVGSALHFDGQTNRVVASTATSMVPTGNVMTLMTWVKPETLDSNMTLFRKNYSYDIRSTGADLFYAKIQNQDSVSSGTNTSSSTLTVNTWNHVCVVVRDDSVNTYLDGVFQRSDPLPMTSIGYNAGQDLFVGDANSTDNTVNNWHGALDDLRVYDRAFSVEEIKEMVWIYGP